MSAISQPTEKFSAPFLVHRFATPVVGGVCPCGATELHRIHEDYAVAGGSLIKEYTYCAVCKAEWHAHDESVYPLPTPQE